MRRMLGHHLYFQLFYYCIYILKFYTIHETSFSHTTCLLYIVHRTRPDLPTFSLQGLCYYDLDSRLPTRPSFTSISPPVRPIFPLVSCSFRGTVLFRRRKTFLHFNRSRRSRLSYSVYSKNHTDYLTLQCLPGLQYHL